jgi:steroid delta-isomerase-like uncharacterized protein
MSEPDAALRERRWAVVAEHIRCEIHGADIAGAVAAFAGGEASYDVVPLAFLSSPDQELTHPSPEDVHAHLTYLTTAFPDLELIPERVHHTDDAVIVEGRSVGTQRGEFMGFPPSGARMDVRACVVYRFDGDRMTNETVYFDLATQLRQLGHRSMEL